MRDYVIMTDSCADLSAEEAAENEVIVLPLAYTIDGVSYLDTPDHDGMPIETLYRRLREGAVCKTAGVGVGAFEDAMARALEGGKDVLCICFSGALLPRVPMEEHDAVMDAVATELEVTSNKLADWEARRGLSDRKLSRR